jgi:hypothetical protein
VLPFNLELWKGAPAITLSNLALTTGPATSLYINNDGNVLSHLTVANQVVLTAASHNTLSHVAVGSRLFVDTGSAGNVFSDSSFNGVQLRSGAHHNSFLHNTIGTLRAFGVGNANGSDLFQENGFTGAVLIAGNSSAATNSTFLNNTFTLATGKPLVLENASGTAITGNTFTAGGAFATAITVHNSDDVVITGNTITTTGNAGTGIYAYADGTGKTSVDVRNNTVVTTNGFGLYFSLGDSTAALEARVQQNDLRQNAAGVTAWGEGTSAGNIDLGGGKTRFGTSLGANDLTSYLTSDTARYAVGLFGTDDAHTLHADHNLWGVADPLAVVADGVHTLEAGGTGLITAFVPPPPPPTPPPPPPPAV